MSFVVYNKETTRYLCNHPKVKTHKDRFATQSAAKSALTRERANINIHDFAIAEICEFHNNIEKFETVKNLMTGISVQQRVNTPLSCDVSSNTYWSM